MSDMGHHEVKRWDLPLLKPFSDLDTILKYEGKSPTRYTVQSIPPVVKTQVTVLASYDCDGEETRLLRWDFLAFRLSFGTEHELFLSCYSFEVTS